MTGGASGTVRPLASPWSVLGRSVRGTAHARLGLRCQDSWGVGHLPGGGLVVAVADGAGSAARSDEGSAVAVRAAVDHVLAALANPTAESDPAAVVAGAVLAAREAVLDLARAESGDAEDAGRDYAATLALALALPAGLWTALRGDCAVVARAADGALFTAGVPRNGEYANQTFFLTDPWEEPFVVGACHPPADALAVLSDGLLPVSVRLADWTPHPGFFAPLFAFAAGGAPDAPQRLGRFLASEKINARTDDDKTVVLAVRGAVTGGAHAEVPAP